MPSLEAQLAEAASELPDLKIRREEPPPQFEEIVDPGLAASTGPPKKILVIDIGGTKVKALATGHHEPRKMASGRRFTPSRLVKTIVELAEGWEYDAISIGFPGLVGPNGPRSEPGNLAPGWVGFDFTAAFGLPVRIANDAVMQALGSYEGGRMLFLGFGTGLGSALIAENVLVPLELGLLPWGEGKTLSDDLARAGLNRLGKKAWRLAVAEVAPVFMGVFVADYVVLGGGNAKEIKKVPPGARLGHNLTAFRGGVRLWDIENVQTLEANGAALPNSNQPAAEWRMI